VKLPDGETQSRKVTHETRQIGNAMSHRHGDHMRSGSGGRIRSRIGKIAITRVGALCRERQG
jgi:hypothetical protein